MNRSKLMELSDEALVHRELALERDLLRARFQMKVGQLENTAVLAALRKDIARARTEERRRELAAGLARNALREKYRQTFQPADGASSPDTKPQQEESGGFLKGVADRFFGSDKKEQAEGAAG